MLCVYLLISGVECILAASACSVIIVSCLMTGRYNGRVSLAMVPIGRFTMTEENEASDAEDSVGSKPGRCGLVGKS